MILAGGKGRRLAPFTFVIPKPIVPIGTMPILEIVLRQLAHHGIRRVTIALGHMSEIVRALAGDGSRFGIDLDYTDEPQPLGTMGPLRLVKDLPEHFLIMNADILTDLDFRAFFDRATGAILALAAANPGKTIALVAHGGVLECAYRLARGLPLETPRDFKVYNASINRFRFNPADRSLVLNSWGEVDHLRPAVLDELP